MDAFTPEAAATYCDDGNWVPDESAMAIITGLLTEVTNNHTCTVDVLEDGAIFGCANNTDVEYLEECDVGSRLSAPPDAEYELEIDPNGSYAQVGLGTTSVASSLRGSAYLSTGPAEFLLSLAWGEPFSYEGDAFTFNHLVLSAPIDVSVSNGSYTVPVTQDFALVLQGYREGEPYVIEFDPTVSSGGSFNVNSGSWDYDYTQSGSGTAIDVHLEGQVLAVNAP